MQGTEQHGPLFIERNGQFVKVRSRHAFSPRLGVLLPTEREGVMHVLPTMALSENETLVLSCVGHDDVVVEGGAA